MSTWKDQARADLQTLNLHHVNEQGAINRAALAKAWGLDPVQYASPFVQTVTNNSNNTTIPPAESPGGSLLKKLVPLLLTGVLGGGLVGGGALLGNLFKGKPETITEKWNSAVEMVVEPAK